MKEGFVEALEARLNAQRRIIIWLVGEMPAEAGARMLEVLNEPYPPQGEAFEVAARRELSEETGLSAGLWTPLFEIDLSTSLTDERCQAFLGRMSVATILKVYQMAVNGKSGSQLSMTQKTFR